MSKGIIWRGTPENDIADLLTEETIPAGTVLRYRHVGQHHWEQAAIFEEPIKFVHWRDKRAFTSEVEYMLVLPETKTASDSQLDNVLAERGSRYGKFINHAEVTQQLKFVARTFVKKVKGVNLETHLTPSQQESLDMIFHKIGRILNGDPNYADSWVDIAGYAKLVADELEGKEV
jgi:hypothetical protein